jgi:hypothetical protein
MNGFMFVLSGERGGRAGESLRLAKGRKKRGRHGEGSNDRSGEIIFLFSFMVSIHQIPPHRLSDY